MLDTEQIRDIQNIAAPERESPEDLERRLGFLQNAIEIMEKLRSTPYNLEVIKKLKEVYRDCQSALDSYDSNNAQGSSGDISDNMQFDYIEG